MPVIDITYVRDASTGQVIFDSNGYPTYAANAGANTYGQMQARIQDEVLGSPTIPQIQNAIQDAVRSFEPQQFDFNVVRNFGATGPSVGSLTTVVGKEFYSQDDLPVLVNMPFISNIQVLAFNNRYSMRNRTTQWIDDQSTSPTWNGMPTDWAWDSGSLRLYPIPNQAWQLIIRATIRFPIMVNDADFSPWTNRGEMLIRQEAKRLLFTNITRNPSQAAAMMEEIYGNPAIGKQGVLGLLRREATTRGGGGPAKIRPSRGFM